MNTRKIRSDLNKIRIESLEKYYGKFTWTEVSPTLFEHDGVVHVSAEDGRGFADYYGEYRGGYPWIHPKLVEYAEKNNMHWEWDNPGSIALYD